MKKYIKTVLDQKFAYYLSDETFCDIRSGIKLDHDGLYQLAECVINITQNTLVKNRHSTLESLVENTIPEKLKVINLDIEYIKMSDVIHVADKVTFSPGGEYAQFQRRNGNITITASNDVKQKLVRVSVEAPRGSGKTTILQNFFESSNAIYNYYVVPSLMIKDDLARGGQSNLKTIVDVFNCNKGSVLDNEPYSELVYCFDDISEEAIDKMIILLKYRHPNAKIIAYSARTPV